MKKIALNLVETVIIINLSLALIVSIAVALIWGKSFGAGVLAGVLAWGLPNWYFSRSFNPDKWLGKLGALKIELYIKVVLRFFFILSIIMVALIIFNVNFLAMISTFMIANLLSALIFMLLNQWYFDNFEKNLKQY